MEIELIDLRSATDLTRLFQADRAERRHAEHRAEFAGGMGDRPFPLVMKEPLQGRRRAIDRHGKFLAHDGNRHVDLADAAQHARQKIAALESRCIAPVGNLIVRRAVDIVEDRAGEALFG